MHGWAEHVWDTGIAFGTVAGKLGDTTVEVTTYRSDVYEKESRKPDVSYGENIEGDLSRRDFRINSMALELTGSSPVFIDPFDGLSDLTKEFYKLLEAQKILSLMIHYACCVLRDLQVNSILK